MDFKITLSIHIIMYCMTNVHGQAYYTKLYKHDNDSTSCTLLEDEFLPNYRGLLMTEESVKVEVTPAVRLPEGAGSEEGEGPLILEFYSESKPLLKEQLLKHCETVEENQQNSGDDDAAFDENSIEQRRFKKSVSWRMRRQPEVRKIVDSGDPANRIDVVFMGDGYDANEREKFFMDIDRFVEEMFEGVTFQSYLPLFNIWAIYVESMDSGIGYDGPKNTPFELYREKGQLRAVFTANAEYARQVCKLTGDYACDFPSLIANDDYYGGLGGEFVIFTRSHQTGKIVLRHEMGHNFLSAGEEYDNGYAYFGVNAARSVDSLKWGHWLSGERKEERAMYRILSYPWVDLHEKPVNYTFWSDGKYNRWQMTLSVTAAERDDSVEFLMDGKPLAWKSTGSSDREFYLWTVNQGFSRGLHHFTVRAKTRLASNKIPTMLASVALHEFGDESEYHIDNEYVSAYPTWNYWRRKSVRPTNAGCIMRNMTHEKFCPVCREGLWINFLSKISLIDNVTVSDTMEADGTKMVSLQTLKLAQFRPAHQQGVAGEYMEIRWLKDDVEQKDLHNRIRIKAPVGSRWTVKVRYETPEVRNDRYGFLKASQRFEVN